MEVVIMGGQDLPNGTYLQLVPLESCARDPYSYASRSKTPEPKSGKLVLE